MPTGTQHRFPAKGSFVLIPLRDNIPATTTPFVNYGLIAICILVFVIQVNSGEGEFVLRYGMVPARLTNPDAALTQPVSKLVQTAGGIQQVIEEVPVPPAAVPEWATLFTCIFLHGGVMHLLGNLWFLYIFGDNVEDRMGHFGYLIFYVGCGVAASFVHFIFSLHSPMPTIGASGAIAGVMGAYLLFYPHAMVVSLVPIIFILQVFVIPAPVFLGIWFVLQLVQGTFSLGSTAAEGVAWWAHIGGFAAGFVVARTMISTGTARPGVTVVRPGTERSTVYRIRR